MGLLYDRIETDEHTIVRFSRYVVGLTSVLFTYMVITLIIRNLILSVVVSVLLVFVISRDMRPVKKELVAAQNAGTLTRSGRRTSLRNPLTYYISKGSQKGQRKPKRKR